jgi:signal peptidase I
MAPTLLPGDRLYVDRAAYRDRPPARGDLVVVRDPSDPRRFLVKRVSFLAGETPSPEYPAVPPGSIYVLGDNPSLSRDSRAFGPVPLDLVVGRAWFRYAPAGRRETLTVTFM